MEDAGMSKDVAIGARSIVEVAQCRVFSERMVDIARKIDLPQHCLADVICASLASLADLNGADPAERLHALDSYYAAAKTHLLNIMTQGAQKQ
jgi:hypothetical protein